MEAARARAKVVREADEKFRMFMEDIEQALMPVGDIPESFKTNEAQEAGENDSTTER